MGSSRSSSHNTVRLHSYNQVRKVYHLILLSNLGSHLLYLGREEFVKYLRTHFPDELCFLIELITNKEFKEASILFARRFPWFLTSSSYRKWCNTKMELPFETEGHDDRLSDFFSELQRANLDEFIIQLASAIGRFPETSPLLLKCPWFRTFVEFVEHFPVAMYLILPDEAQGFPVVYANLHTRVITGYPRTELLGEQCPFFMCQDGKDTEKFDYLRQCLKDSIPFQTSVQSVRKNGSRFQGTFCCKPMYDVTSVYRFTLVAHLDIATSEQIELIGDFFSVVPNIICYEP